jgi:hypothetical protein
MTDFIFQTTPRAICQISGLAQVGDLMAGLGVSQAIVVCDAGIVVCGFADRAVASLRTAGLAATVFDQVQADPPVGVVRAAIHSARAFGADGVIGLGGGSSLDGVVMSGWRPINGVFLPAVTMSSSQLLFRHSLGGRKLRNCNRTAAKNASRSPHL